MKIKLFHINALALAVIMSILVCNAIFLRVSIPIYKHFFKKEKIEAVPNSVAPNPEDIKIVYHNYKPTHARSIYGKSVDTIRTISSSDTVYLYPFKNDVCGNVVMVLTTDSLSGCTNGRVMIEYSRLGIVWDRVPFTDEQIINGSTKQQFNYNGTICGRKIRYKVITPLSTQQTRMSLNYVFEKY